MSQVISIEPMIQIEFSKYGAFATKHWPSGLVEELPVSEAMREFDRLAAAGHFEKSESR